jgi:hypothetical protein
VTAQARRRSLYQSGGTNVRRYFAIGLVGIFIGMGGTAFATRLQPTAHGTSVTEKGRNFQSFRAVTGSGQRLDFNAAFSTVQTLAGSAVAITVPAGKSSLLDLRFLGESSDFPNNMHGRWGFAIDGVPPGRRIGGEIDISTEQVLGPIASGRHLVTVVYSADVAAGIFPESGNWDFVVQQIAATS